MDKPRWTIVYNIISPENPKWIGTGWEFFDKEEDAEKCYDRHVKNGNCPTKRYYYAGIKTEQNQFDYNHLGAAHKQ